MGRCLFHLMSVVFAFYVGQRIEWTQHCLKIAIGKVFINHGNNELIKLLLP